MTKNGLRNLWNASDAKSHSSLAIEKSVISVICEPYIRLSLADFTDFAE